MGSRWWRTRWFPCWLTMLGERSGRATGAERRGGTTISSRSTVTTAGCGWLGKTVHVHVVKPFGWGRGCQAEFLSCRLHGFFRPVKTSGQRGGGWAGSSWRLGSGVTPRRGRFCVGGSSACRATPSSGRWASLPFPRIRDLTVCISTCGGGET